MNRCRLRLAWGVGRLIRVASLVLLISSTGWSQATQPAAGPLVVLRALISAAPGDYLLQSLDDGRVVHSQKVLRMAYYCRSHDRLVVIGQETVDRGHAEVFALPQGNSIARYVINGVFVGGLKQGAVEYGIIDGDFAYFSTAGGVLVKLNLRTGEQEKTPGIGGALRRAGNYLLSESQFAWRGHSIPDLRAEKSVPRGSWDRAVFVPGEGLYQWYLTGEVGRVATETLDAVPEAEQKFYMTARGIHDALVTTTSTGERQLVILSGPHPNGELRGEAREWALLFVKPSDGTIVATIKPNFTPVQRVFAMQQENVIALVNEDAHSIVRYDVVARRELDRTPLPPVEAEGRAWHTKVIY